MVWELRSDEIRATWSKSVRLSETEEVDDDGKNQRRKESKDGKTLESSVRLGGRWREVGVKSRMRRRMIRKQREGRRYL